VIAVCSRSFSQNPILRQELLTQFSDVRFNEKGKQLSGDELVEFLKGAEKAIIALESLDESILSKLPDLRVIGKFGVGLDKIDFSSLKKFNVKMGWTPGVNAQGVAELTLMMAMSALRNMHVSDRMVREGQWKQISGRQLSSITYGILGCGHVGKALAKLLRSFGCKVLVCDILSQPHFYNSHGITEVSLSELFSSSDLLSIHIPKNKRTEKIVNRNLLQSMKKRSVLINTARGGIVDEAAVLELLNTGHLAGAGFDVFENEPPTNRDLIQHPHFISTGHIGGSSEEAVLAMGRAAIRGLTDFKPAEEFLQYV
jgi:phosphoglycerate dehydrogenase-like enzyme